MTIEVFIHNQMNFANSRRTLIAMKHYLENAALWIVSALDFEFTHQYVVHTQLFLVHTHQYLIHVHIIVCNGKTILQFDVRRHLPCFTLPEPLRLRN